MSPPIRDGSGNDIGAIRLGDGSEISEVRTGAGDVLFSAIPPAPDSANLRARYDARELSLTDGSAVSTWADVSGNGNDLSFGSDKPTFRDASSSTIGSVPTVDFDGSDDFLETLFTSSVSTPFSIFWLGRYNTVSNFEELMGPKNAPSNGWVSLSNDGSWRYGLNGTNGPTGTTVDTNPHVHANILGTSDGSDWYIDQTEIINNGGFSVDNLDGIAVGARGSGKNNSNSEFVEILVYETDKEGSRLDVEKHLDRDTAIL